LLVEGKGVQATPEESDSRKIKPKRNQDEKLMPVAGGMKMAPVRATGTLMYSTQVLGYFLVSAHEMTGAMAPARSHQRMGL
jgi:hypothetical protein